MTDLADRLREIADYYMEHGCFPEYRPFDGVMAQAWPISDDWSMPWNPSEVRFSAWTKSQTFVTSRPWREFKRRPQEVPKRSPLRFLDGLLYNRTKRR